MQYGYVSWGYKRIINMKKITLKIEGMHCASCPIMIDGTLEDDVKGVVRAETSYAKQECVIEYDENKVTEASIIEAVEKIGYCACSTQTSTVS